MNRNTLIVVIVAVVLVAGVTAWFAYGIFTSPLHQVDGRTCVGCAEVHTGNLSRIEAGTLSGTYRFREATDWVIRFEAGSIQYNDASLEPGCYTGVAELGDMVTFEGATDVLVEAPAPEDACEEA